MGEKIEIIENSTGKLLFTLRAKISPQSTYNAVYSMTDDTGLEREVSIYQMNGDYFADPRGKRI